MGAGHAVSVPRALSWITTSALIRLPSSSLLVIDGRGDLADHLRCCLAPAWISSSGSLGAGCDGGPDWTTESVSFSASTASFEVVLNCPAICPICSLALRASSARACALRRRPPQIPDRPRRRRRLRWRREGPSRLVCSEIWVIDETSPLILADWQARVRDPREASVEAAAQAGDLAVGLPHQRVAVHRPLPAGAAREC